MEDGAVSQTAEPRRSGGCGPAHEPPPELKPEEKYVPQPSPADAPVPDYASTASPPPMESLAAFHRDAGSDFLDPERFGYVKDREHVAGFEPHAFRNMPALDRTAAQEWSLERVELVSLRKPGGPHAYLSENLPKVDALKTADTRLLDDFEIRALAKLRTAEDVVVEEAGGVVRVLGALRAGNQCVRCHAGSRGELIGGLSYEFHRKSRPPLVVQQ
jgi:hypothetical protein